MPWIRPLWIYLAGDSLLLDPEYLFPSFHLLFIQVCFLPHLCSVAQPCLIVCDPMDCSLPCSVCGNFQTRILEWVAISYSRGPSQPRDWTHASCISCIGRQTLSHRTASGTPVTWMLVCLRLFQRALKRGSPGWFPCSVCVLTHSCVSCICCCFLLVYFFITVIVIFSSVWSTLCFLTLCLNSHIAFIHSSPDFGEHL